MIYTVHSASITVVQSVLLLLLLLLLLCVGMHTRVQELFWIAIPPQEQGKQKSGVVSLLSSRIRFYNFKFIL